MLISLPFTKNVLIKPLLFTHDAVLLSSPFTPDAVQHITHDAVLLSLPFTHDAVHHITHDAVLLPFPHDAGRGGQAVGLAVGLLAAGRSWPSSGGAGGGGGL